MKPEVSVIISVYRRLDFLAQALQSALAQTFTAREIIVADDSGTGAARTICQPLIETGKITYRANPQRLGIARSLRAAIEAAQGEFISFLNDDDVWEPEFLAALVPPLRADPNRALAFSDHWIMMEDGSIDGSETEANTRRYGRASLPEGDVADPARLVFVDNGVPLAMAAVFRKDAVDLSLLTAEVSGAYDFWISCLLAASGRKFDYVPKRLTRYRVHPQSETGRRSADRSENQVYIFTEILKRNWFPEMKTDLRARLANAHFRVGRDQLAFDRVREARASFLKSFRTKPAWRPILAAFLSLLPRSLRARS